SAQNPQRAPDLVSGLAVASFKNTKGALHTARYAAKVGMSLASVSFFPALALSIEPPISKASRPGTSTRSQQLIELTLNYSSLFSHKDRAGDRRRPWVLPIRSKSISGEES